MGEAAFAHKDMKYGKASGEDGILEDVTKHPKKERSQQIRNVLSHCIHKERLPDS